MKNRIISASAGSGKTFKLTEVLYQDIHAGNIEPEEVIAVTFTRNAANELKERVRSRLFEKGQGDAGNRIEGALIGTVHSVCERILKRFSFEAGISPDYQVIPEEESGIIIGESISAIIKARDLSRYSAAKERLEMEDDISSIIYKLVNIARVNRLKPQSLKDMADENSKSYLSVLPAASTPESSNLSEDLAAALDQTIEAVKNNMERQLDTTKKTNEYLMEIKRLASKLNTRDLSWKELAVLQANEPGKKSDSLCEDLKNTASRHLDHPLFREDIEVYLHMVFDVAAEACDSYDQWKKERGLVDFTDMVEKVYELLEKPHVAETLGSEYRLLMVDEFQDTSPLQLALFNRLGKAAGRMVWVGDKKQCIFGFLDSDPELMDAAYNALSRNAETSYLEQSWRSRPDLVKFSNAIFSKTFGMQGYDIHEVILEPVRKNNDSLPPCLEVWQTEGTNAADDAAMLARGISRLLDPRDPQIIEDRHTGKPRPVKPGDIAILRRTNNDCTNVAEELGILGIRSSISRTGLTCALEGHYLLSACDAVLDPKASLPPAVLLHIRTGGSPETLVDSVIARRNSGGNDTRLSFPWEDDPVFDGLRELANQAPCLSPSELLDKVIEKSGLRDLCLHREHPEFHLGNVEMFRAYARQYEETCRFRNRPATFLGLCLYLKNLKDGGNQAAVESPDSINVLTYHRAKGLEWPVVILGDLDKKLNESLSSTSPRAFSASKEFNIDDPLSGRSIRYWPWPYGMMKSNAPLWEPVMNSKLESAFSERYIREEQRLMYVGFTRARDVLILPVRQGAKSGGRPARIKFLNADMELPIDKEEGVHTCDFNLSVPFVMRMRHINKSMSETIPLGKDMTWFARPAGDAPLRQRLYMSPSRMAPLEDALVTAEYSLGNRIAGTFNGDAEDTALGNAVHDFYAADDMSISLEERIMMALEILKSYDADNCIAPQTLVETSDRLMNFIKDRWPGGTILRELPLQSRMEGHISRGIADIIVETEEEIHLIDHKTYPGNAVHCRERALEYSGQLRAYADVLEKAVQKKCTTMAIHYPVEGLIVELEAPVENQHFGRTKKR